MPKRTIPRDEADRLFRRIGVNPLPQQVVIIDVDGDIVQVHTRPRLRSTPTGRPIGGKPTDRVAGSPDDRPFRTTGEAARILGVSTETVRRW